MTEEERRAADVAASSTARERLEAMLGCAPAFIVAVSRTGTIDFINRTLPQYVKSDVIGMSWLAFFAPDLQALMAGKLQTLFDTSATQLFETCTAGPDGTPHWFDTQLAPIHGGDQIVGAILVSQDVTERKRAQAELLASRHMALLGTLAAGVAHEINTPVQFVRDSVEFMRDATMELLALLETLHQLRETATAGSPLAPLVEAAHAAEDAADLAYVRDNLPPAFERSLDGLNQIAKIVRSLKDFSHPSGETMVPVDLNQVVQNALTIATNEYKLVATVETHLAALPPITCRASEIGQVVLNIVVNAAHAIGDVVKGTDHKGVITVATRSEGTTAVIEIGDTGGGIADAIKARVFDPFFTTKEVGKGTGQGLSIAWTMVKERHGGELTFKTEPGVGTTFMIRLPNAAPVAPKPAS